jgi:hypothetical protein
LHELSQTSFDAMLAINLRGVLPVGQFVDRGVEPVGRIEPKA